MSASVRAAERYSVIGLEECVFACVAGLVVGLRERSLAGGKAMTGVFNCSALGFAVADPDVSGRVILVVNFRFWKNWFSTPGYRSLSSITAGTRRAIDVDCTRGIPAS